ncbi:BPL-N domain-containing protein [Rhodococcus kronopolitis]|uniref:BPL-N domain-containing protein n=1 Tax=Rhodococcus kronopolitis TaxID=1460226 RepID=A0ABV9FS37_9NOCA
MNPGRRTLTRRGLLLGVGAVALGGGAAAFALQPRTDDRPVALVYRGKAACQGCAESVAQLLETAPTPFRAVYCGPGEDVELTAEALAGAAVYAQPGGGEVGPAWRRMRAHADDVRAFVHGGGNYLGFCLGAYLAGTGPGFGLIPEQVNRYMDTEGSEVHDTDDTVVAVDWRGGQRHMFFQDGPQFTGDWVAAPATTVLARYRTGTVAAAVTGYGAGRVGVVGPHPEADESWYSGPGLTNPDGIRFDLGHDLIATTVER